MDYPHESQAAERSRTQPVRCAVLTVSDTRTEQTDRGGPLVERFLREAGHGVIARAIVKDDPPAIEGAIEGWLGDPAIHAVLTTGGTGIARRDTTIEVVRRLITIELEGFGELFRMLSFEQVKGAAMLSRAVGGLVIRNAASGGDTLLFAMPGSLNAIETAMKNLIAPQLAHLVWERR
jgi:molybdenum cofactor biosynthesis protein B